MDSNFGMSQLLRPNSDSSVLKLYVKPIESRFHPYACGGQWVLELAGKGLSSRSGRLAWLGYLFMCDLQLRKVITFSSEL